jgi:hypothetical protein
MERMQDTSREALWLGGRLVWLGGRLVWHDGAHYITYLRLVQKEAKMSWLLS